MPRPDLRLPAACTVASMALGELCTRLGADLPPPKPQIIATTTHVDGGGVYE